MLKHSFLCIYLISALQTDTANLVAVIYICWGNNYLNPVRDKANWDYFFPLIRLGLFLVWSYAWVILLQSWWKARVFSRASLPCLVLNSKFYLLSPINCWRPSCYLSSGSYFLFIFSFSLLMPLMSQPIPQGESAECWIHLVSFFSRILNLKSWLPWSLTGDFQIVCCCCCVFFCLFCFGEWAQRLFYPAFLLVLSGKINLLEKLIF